MTRADDLDSLTQLDRSHIHVFVAGPGLGEGIAVALPGAGWLLVDGCTTGEELPLETIVTRYRSSADEPVVAMVLTHPHEDHVEGFAELIEVFAPRHIGLVRISSDGRDLSTHARQTLRAVPARAEQLHGKRVLAALTAIDGWSESHPGRLLALHDGIEIPVAPSPAKVFARSPSRPQLDQLTNLFTLPSPLGASRMENDPNRLSIVLEIVHGSSRVVLTSDLPRYFTGTTTPISTGWDRVMADHAHLGAHAVLKIPHHGSAEAMHPDLMPARDAEQRAWCVTPYNRSRLPRVADMDGLPRMLAWQPSILLTALPASKKHQADEPHPGIVRLSQLASRIALQPTGARFVDSAGVHVTRSDAYEPLDPVWCVAVDESANLVGRWRGRVALEVVPDPLPSP